MAKIIFILGGARSGKSQYALKLAKESNKRIAFIATAESKDREMKKRIGLHKKSRPRHWTTFEEPQKLPKVLKENGHKFELFIIDCLTLLICNLLLAGFSQKDIKEKINQVIAIIKKLKADVIIISNEVGLGIVPENKLARDFRDISGRINQIVAANADKVFFMAAGLPLRIK